MSNTNNKPAAGQDKANITMKELLNFSDALCTLSITIDKAFFILETMSEESTDIGININKKEEMCTKAIAFNNMVKWCNILDDYVCKSSQYAKALLTEYGRICNKLKGAMQNV